MNIKKYIQKLAEEDADACLTEEDKAYIKELVKANELKGKKKKSGKKKKKITPGD